MSVQSGLTAIVMASKSGHSGVVKLLMGEDVKDIAAKLISSSENGDREEAELFKDELLSRGYHLNQRDGVCLWCC